MAWKEIAESALIQSIEHWQRMADGTHAEGEGPTGQHCACCKQFQQEDDCGTCPIELAGGDVCANTPYTKAAAAFNLREHGYDYQESAMHDEIEYLFRVLALVESGDLEPC